MRKEPIVVGAVLLAVAFAAFFMAWQQHDELLNREAIPSTVSVSMPMHW